MAGRPPKPTAQKRLQGNPGKRPLPEREPELTVKVPPAPRWLSKAAKAAWKELGARLAKMRVITEADATALELLCEAYAEWVALRKTLRKRGRVYTSKTQSGGRMIRPRPEVAQEADAWRRVQRMLTEFGMTPSSRTKVQTQAPETADPLEEFMRAKRRGPDEETPN